MAFSPELQTLFDGWRHHQSLLVAAVRELTDEQVQLRVAPGQWAAWQIVGHIAGARAYWMYDVLGEGEAATRDLFRVEQTTVPGLALKDAGWEDDEDRPRGSGELVEGLERSWAMLEECAGRWTPAMLDEGHPNLDPGETRLWVLWHLIEHDVHHGGQLSLILGSHGLPGLGL